MNTTDIFDEAWIILSHYGSCDGFGGGGVPPRPPRMAGAGMLA